MDTAIRCLFLVPEFWPQSVLKYYSRYCSGFTNLCRSVHAAVSSTACSTLDLKIFPSCRTSPALILWLPIVIGVFYHDPTLGAESVNRLPSITATRLDYNKFTDQLPRRSYVTLAANGMEAADVNPSDNIVVNQFIHDFEADSAWLVSVRRQQYAALDLTDSGIQAKYNSKNLSGVLNKLPCAHGSGSNLGETVWRGLRVESWHCYNSSSVGTTRQFYSVAWQLVVLEERSNGDTAEIRDIKIITPASQHFEPNSDYDEIELIDFLSDASLPALEIFSESEPQ